MLYSFGKSIGLNWIYSKNILIYCFVFLPHFYLVFMKSLYPVFSSNITPKNEVRIVTCCDMYHLVLDREVLKVVITYFFMNALFDTFCV